MKKYRCQYRAKAIITHLWWLLIWSLSLTITVKMLTRLAKCFCCPVLDNGGWLMQRWAVIVPEYVKWAPIIYVLWQEMESYFQNDGNNRQFNYMSFSLNIWFLQIFHFYVSISFSSGERFILFVFFDILHFKEASFCPISWQHDSRFFGFIFFKF